MSDLEDLIFTLKIFNEKVVELLDSGFVKSISDPNAGVSISGERQEDGSFKTRSMIRGPSNEAIKAFVLTFRFFIQNNEKTSLHNISTLYDSNIIDSNQKKLFQSAKTEINKYLDSPNPLNLTIYGNTPTNRQVMNVFVYGGLAHANPENYKTYKDWMSFPPTATLLQMCFNTILGNILQALDYIRQVNINTLQQLFNSKS